MLLHSLTVRVEDFEGSFAITAIEAFVDDFYKCDHCRDQFRNITSRCVNSSDLVLSSAIPGFLCAMPLLYKVCRIYLTH